MFLKAQAPTPPVQHSDDAAVDRFAAAMKAKLAQKRAEGRGGWDDPEQCPVERLAELLHKHVGKGDPVDVANFAMMLWCRGGRTTPSVQQDDEALEVLLRIVEEIDGLTQESDGVYGLHRNGDQSPWHELLPGGEYERLSSLDEARALLAKRGEK